MVMKVEIPPNLFDPFLVLESMTESVIITDAHLEDPGPFIIYANPAFEKMTGWSREEVIGKSPRILQGAKTEHGIFKDLRSTLEVGKIWSGRTINYRKDGSDFYMEWSIVPIHNASGDIHQYLAVQREVTYIVDTEHQLQDLMQLERKRRKEIEKTNTKLNRVVGKQKKTLDLFTKFVPEPIVQRALSQDEDEILDGEQIEAALLFCDIRGFTAIAERLKPPQVVSLLNTYYAEMSKVVDEHKGVINQFVGDEIFVAFGAPLPVKDPHLCAVQCAIEMIRKLENINERLQKELGEKIAVGIGINYGPVVAGNLGSEDRLSYSITGDTVITAKRIESLTRAFPNTILISANIQDKIPSQIITQPLDSVEMKGKNKKIEVFKVVI